MNIRVLVVDDDAAIRGLCRRVLNHLGCEVVCVASPEEALRTVTPRFDLVITDLRMPGRRGDALAQDLRRLYPELRIVVTTTSLDDDGLLREMKDLQVSVLTKPAGIQGLVGLVPG